MNSNKIYLQSVVTVNNMVENGRKTVSSSAAEDPMSILNGTKRKYKTSCKTYLLSAHRLTNVCSLSQNHTMVEAVKDLCRLCNPTSCHLEDHLKLDAGTETETLTIFWATSTSAAGDILPNIAMNNFSLVSINTLLKKKKKVNAEKAATF